MKVIGMLAACLGLSLAQAQAQAAEDLFLPQQKPASAISAAPRQLPQSALSEDTPVRSALHGLRVNPLAFEDKQLSFRLPDGLLIEADLVHQYATKNGATVWIVKHRLNPNQVAMAGDNESVLVIRNGHITGNVRHQLKLYQIRANAVGEHSIGEIALEKMPPDHRESSYLNTPVGPRLGAYASHPWNKSSLAKWKRTGELAEYDERHLQDLAASKVDAQLATVKSVLMPAPTEAPVIRVMVHYTSAAKAGAGTAENAIEDLINLSVAETNRSFQNSTINARVELASSALVNYVESDDADIDKQRYVGKNDGFMDEVHAQRDQYAADVGVLILEKLGGVCGSAAKIGADAASAFVVVKRSCSAGSLSFPHEIGHLFGARHNIEKDANVTIPYAHGYQNPEFKWRTIMAYDCTIACPRLPYWSNPRVIYSDGVAMGLAASADNARVLNEQAAVMAAFRPPLTEKNSAPVVDAGPNMQIVSPATAALNGTASDDGLPQGSSLSYAWSQVSGPGVVTVSDAKALRTSAGFSSPGTYVLRLTASDGSLQTSDDVTVTVIANQLPTAYFSSSSNGLVLSLQDASSDADGQVRAWQWTFGDGTSSALQNPVHTYLSAGNYTVSLSVTDDRGAKSAVFSREVTVLSGTPSDTVLLQSSAGGTKMDVKLGQLGAQSFKYGSTGSYVVNKLIIYVSRDSVAPNSALQVSIGSSVNGGTVINGSVSIPASALTDASAGAHFQRVEIPFSQGVSLNAGRIYYINLSTNASNGKAYYLELSSGSTAYSGGSYFKNKSDEKKDLRFSVIGH